LKSCFGNGDLSQSINNLLFLSRVDARQNRVLDDSVPLGEIVLSTCEKLEPVALEKNIGLSFENVSPLVVHGERALLLPSFSPLTKGLESRNPRLATCDPF